jgi:hypothetical protein
MATAFTVSNESKPNTAIRAIDAGGADAAPDTAYTIKITGTIDLTSVPTGLKPNRLHSRTETIPRITVLENSFQISRNIFRRLDVVFGIPGDRLGFSRCVLLWQTREFQRSDVGRAGNYVKL